jgi:CheY-like chemotaxis protein
VRPRLVLLDLVMPVMDGRAFRTWQKSESAFADIPVVIMSAAIDAAEQSRAIGASGYVKKPVSLDALVAAVQAHAAAPLTRRPPPAPPSTP